MEPQPKEKTISELLDDLITDDTPDEIISKIGEIKQATQRLTDDRDQAIETAHNYRSKYINVIQNGDFGTTSPEEPQEKGPISIDELVEQYSQSKE